MKVNGRFLDSFRASRLTSRVLSCAASLLFFGLAGCSSVEVLQEAKFVDNDGRIVLVTYARCEKEHVFTFKAPTNGKEMEFRSKLRVDVEMPDGDGFTGYGCMSTLRTGTMYKSEDGEWMFHANGFTCSVYKLDEAASTEERQTHALVFQGVVCQAPKKGT